MNRSVTPFASILMAGVLMLSCGGAQPGVGDRVENQALRLAFAEVPAPFRLEKNEGRELRLSAPGENGRAEVWVEVGEETAAGINLVDHVEARKAAFKALPEGVYYGTRELGMPSGPAFTARGAYDEGSQRLEEIWVFTLHPQAERLVSLVYRYPARDDSSQRVEELLILLSELEGLDAQSE